MASDFETIFKALADAQVRYLTVGGVAVVLHGTPRFTADLDLVIDFERANLERALTAFESLGYQPRAPIPLRDFADGAKRREWVASKNLVVLSLWSPHHPATEVDVFVEPPFPFDEAFSRSLHADLGVATALVVSKADLIAMKRHAGRPKDLEDIRALSLISNAPSGASGDGERDG